MYPFFHSRLKSTYGRVSTTTEPTNEAVKAKLLADIAKGKHSIGELVTPLEFTTTKMVQGEVENVPFTVYGRKIPFKTIRDQISQLQLKYMRIKPDEYYHNLSRDEVVENLQRIGEFKDEDQQDSLPQLQNRLMIYERSRSTNVTL